MQLIGLSGGIASGKSTASEHLKRKGIPVIDADVLAREALDPGRPAYRQVCRMFPEVLRPDGLIDRERLAEVVFAEPTARRKLEKLIHPRVKLEIAKRVVWYWLRGYDRIVLDIPLLFETGLFGWMSYTIVVSACRETQIRRMQIRNGMSVDQAQARVAAQMPMALKCAKADVVIENEGTLEELYDNLDRALAVRSPSRIHHQILLHAVPLATLIAMTLIGMGLLIKSQ